MYVKDGVNTPSFDEWWVIFVNTAQEARSVYGTPSKSLDFQLYSQLFFQKHQALRCWALSKKEIVDIWGKHYRLAHGSIRQKRAHYQSNVTIMQRSWFCHLHSRWTEQLTAHCHAWSSCKEHDLVTFRTHHYRCAQTILDRIWQCCLLRLITYIFCIAEAKPVRAAFFLCCWVQTVCLSASHCFCRSNRTRDVSFSFNTSSVSERVDLRWSTGCTGCARYRNLKNQGFSRVFSQSFQWFFKGYQPNFS